MEEDRKKRARIDDPATFTLIPSSPPFDVLPFDLIIYLFSFLPSRAHTTITSLISKTWCRAARRSITRIEAPTQVVHLFPNLTQLNPIRMDMPKPPLPPGIRALHLDDAPAESLPHFITHAASLTDLSITLSKSNAQIISLLTECVPGLKKLSCSFLAEGKEEVEAVMGFLTDISLPHLESLKLSSLWFEEGAVFMLPRMSCPSLAHLSLGYPVSDEAITSHITSLEVTVVVEEDADFPPFVESIVSQLSSLTVSVSLWNSDIAVPLEVLPYITSLDIEGSSIDHDLDEAYPYSEVMQMLEPCTRLASLSMHDVAPSFPLYCTYQAQLVRMPLRDTYLLSALLAKRKVWPKLESLELEASVWGDLSGALLHDVSFPRLTSLTWQHYAVSPRHTPDVIIAPLLKLIPAAPILVSLVVGIRPARNLAALHELLHFANMRALPRVDFVFADPVGAVPTPTNMEKPYDEEQRQGMAEVKLMGAALLWTKVKCDHLASQDGMIVHKDQP